MKAVWRNIPVGTIVDSDITRLAQNDELITDEFDGNSVKQACYELRASDIFYDVASARENKRIQVAAQSGLILRPNCYVVCIVMERLRLPPNVLGRILTKGHLFSIGILPVNTYADPGFEGRLGITLYNGSQRYLVIRPREAIAKIEFEVLPKAVEHPYIGQHEYETQVWPIATRFFADLEGDSSLLHQVGDENEEIRATFGPQIAKMHHELRFYKRTVWIQLFTIIAGFTVIFKMEHQMGLMLSIGVGIASNLLTTLGVTLFSDWRRKRS